MAISYFDDQPLGSLPVRTNSAIGSLETVTGLSVVHKQLGTQVRSTFTLANVLQDVVDATQYQFTKLFTFPAGEIQFMKANVSLQQKTTSAIVSTIIAAAAGKLGIGTAPASNTTLAATMINLVPGSGETPTAFTTSQTINVLATLFTAKLKTGVAADFFVIDGTAAPSVLYLNTAYPTAGDVLANGTQTLTGTVVVEWQLLSYDFGF
jgi:hypothetical protein